MLKFEKVDKITSDLFEDVIIYTIAEPGAMGVAKLMEFVGKNGNCFSFIYGDEISYSDVKECFPVLNDCFWNGPMEGENTDGEIIFFTTDNKKNNNSTKVPEGWQHIYTGFGNHLVVKEEFYPTFSKYIKDFKRPVDIFSSWEEWLDIFIEEINQK